MSIIIILNINTIYIGESYEHQSLIMKQRYMKTSTQEEYMCMETEGHA